MEISKNWKQNQTQDTIIQFAVCLINMCNVTELASRSADGGSRLQNHGKQVSKHSLKLDITIYIKAYTVIYKNHIKFKLNYVNDRVRRNVNVRP